VELSAMRMPEDNSRPLYAAWRRPAADLRLDWPDHAERSFPS